MGRGYEELNPIWSVYPVWLKMPVVFIVAMGLAPKRSILKFLCLGMSCVVLWNFSILIGN